MSLWLRVDTDPPVALYRERAALAYVDCDLRIPALSTAGVLSRQLSRPPDAPGEVANLRIGLDNAEGVLTKLWTVPPVRIAATLYQDADTIFEGLITSIDLSARASLQLVAGGTQPLSNPLPLRSSAVWGGFGDVVALPIVYGRATVAPVQYSQDRRLWLVADHPVQGIDAVRRDDVATTEWSVRNTVDSVGQAVAIIELALPLADGERLAVDVRGRVHPARGHLLTAPAEILWDLLANVAGMDLAEADLFALRADLSGIELGGVIDDPLMTTRSQIDRILASAGAAWSAGMPGLACAWPPVDQDDAALATIDRLTATSLAPTCEDAGLCTVLRVLFDYDFAAGTHRQAVQIEAPEAIRQYGRIERELDAGWLHNARLADALGRAYLAWSARPVWTVTWRADITAGLRPGDWVEITHPESPVQGRHRLTRADLDLDRGSLALAVSAPAGQAPALSAARLSESFEPLIQAGAHVVYQDGVATLTIQDDLGQPLSGATVTMDGAQRRVADAAGRVSFKAARGRHALLVEAAGYQAMTLEIVL
ncbi:MAG: carboxypeptidase-like regulatory domain-containing protein [Pseudomonadota bacterium]